MKTLNVFLIPIVTALLVYSTSAQQPTRTPRPGGPYPGGPAPGSENSEELATFDLDFPGGTAGELVAAISKASDRPLNAIIPDELKTVRIPPLKMKSVNVAELFKALESASRRTISYKSESIDYQVGSGGPRIRSEPATMETFYGFYTQDPVRDDSVWFFYAQLPPQAQESKLCRFWQLGRYLDRYRIEDITTAIQTGYKMLGTEPPAINFHQDTKLLIAVGEADKLTLIDMVLQELPPAPSPEVETNPGAGRPAAGTPKERVAR